MKIDETALEAAHEAWDREIGDMIPSRISADMERNALRGAIEAYEAAKWRPIAEARRDGTKICVWWAAGKGPIRSYPENMEFLWWENDCWLSDLGGRALNHDGCVEVGAMFCTIDPPPKP